MTKITMKYWVTLMMLVFASFTLTSCTLIGEMFHNHTLSAGDQFDDALSNGYIRSYTEQIEKGDTRPFVYRQRGNNYQSLGLGAANPKLVQKAILDYSTAINTGDDLEAHWKRGICYLWMAKRDLDKSNELGYRDKQSMREAMTSTDPNATIGIVPADGKAYCKRAAAYYTLGIEDMRTARLRGYWEAKNWQPPPF